jgi:hypothetical protein
MVGILKFKLPEEDEDFKTALYAIDYKDALSEINKFLRMKLKHGEFPEEVMAVYQEVREQLTLLTEGLEI